MKARPIVFHWPPEHKAVRGVLHAVMAEGDRAHALIETLEGDLLSLPLHVCRFIDIPDGREAPVDWQLIRCRLVNE